MLRRLVGLMFFAISLMAMQSGVAALARERPKVAVYHFDDPADTGLGLQLRTKIEAALVQTNKFDVHSRHFSTSDTAEQARSPIGEGGPAPAAQPVDYAVEVTISRAQLTDLPDVIGPLIGIPGLCKVQKIEAAVDLVMKDVRTGATVFATSASKVMQQKCGRTAVQVDMATVIDELSKDLAFQLATQFYPVKAIGFGSDGLIILDYGEPFLTVGTYLIVSGPREKLNVDGRTIELPGPVLGRVKVEMTMTNAASAVNEGRAKLKLVAGATARIDDNQKPAQRATN